MLHSGTVPQRGGIPVNMREALAGGARWACREFVYLSGGGNEALVMGDMRRPSRRPRPGSAEEVGIAPVRRKEEMIMLPHRAGSQRMARGGVSSRPDAGTHPGGPRRNMARVWHAVSGGAAWRPSGLGVLGQGWECGRSHSVAKCNAKG